MIRDASKSVAWYDEWIAYDRQRMAKAAQMRLAPLANSTYEPHFVYELSGLQLHLLLRRYCRGDPVASLREHLAPMVDAWAASDELGRSVWTEEQWSLRHDWRRNRNFYQRCFWVAALALALDWPGEAWPRLLALMGNEGQDTLLDRVLATRQPQRRIGSTLCHPKVYQGLLKVVDAPSAAQAAALRRYVAGWYASQDRPPRKGLSRLTNSDERPYWYDYADYEGAYFGHWCLEAVAVVQALGVADSACLGLPNYPGDLVHPDGPSTHVAVAVAVDDAGMQATKGSWWERLRRPAAR